MLKLLVCRGYSSRRRRVVSVVAIGLAFVGVYFSLSHFPMNKDRATVDGVRLNVNFQRGILNAGRETVHERSSAEGEVRGPKIDDPGSLAGPKIDDPGSLADGADAPTTAHAHDCYGPWPGHAQCALKMKWLAKNWHTNSCYAVHGVDGSPCSFQRYLSEVERWCPLLDIAERQSLSRVKDAAEEMAVPQLDFEPLQRILASNKKFKWISNRISTHWRGWVAGHKMKARETPANFTKRNILLHSGVLSDKANHHYAEGAFKGGPLGELVQWADLITAIFMLGHHMTISTEITQLRSILSRKEGTSCPAGEFDVIYVDIVGLRQFKDVAKDNFQQYLCKFRVLDTFGTEPQFNYKEWKPEEFSRMKDMGQEWGNWNLNPRQILTLYPHTPDNSFLGFVVGEFKRNESPLPKEDIAVVYGKEFYMWKKKKPYLDVISKYLEIHSTIGTRRSNRGGSIRDVPDYVVHHGVLKFDDLQKLLKRAKLFVGLGFPYEGPAPLEGIANGCFFFNPQIRPPLSRLNSVFMKVKPTLRAFTSQNPYAERFIAKPYVYTINMQNLSEVDNAMRDMMRQPTPPGYLPYEFTYEGMLERLSVYLEHQDFCDPHQWPREEVLITKLSKEGQSCKQRCYDDGLVCEPDLLSLLNNKKALSRHFNCSSVYSEHSYHGPSHHSTTGSCSLQKDHLLLSCVGEAGHVTRLCPCRKYRKGQVALCVDCIR